MNVFPASGATCSCMPVGELSDAMCTEPDSLGGTRYCLPEGTLLSVQVADVSAGPDEWCTRGPLVLHERVGGGSTSHASMRALIHPTGARVSGGACCCDDEDWFCLCGWPSIPQYHTFYGGPGGVMFTSLQVLDMYSDDLYFQGGSVTLCSDLPGMDPTLPQKVYFEMKAYTGYQHLYTLVYDEDGELVATVYPAQGLRETTWIETSCAEGRLRGVAETVQQPTLKVDIEVEGNLVPAAVAGHYTFPQPDGCAGARKNYTYAIDNPDPEPDTPTELIAVSLNRNDGFVLKSWTGNCAYFDASGNYLGMLPATLPDDPDDWVTGDTLYVKCLEAQPTQMASATTDMAVLAGASMVPMDQILHPLVEVYLKPHVTAGRAVVVQGQGIHSKAAKDVESRLRRLDIQSESLNEPFKSDILAHLADTKANIFYYNGHGGLVDGAGTMGIVPNSPGSPTPEEFWLTAEEVADVNNHAYKLIVFSACRQAQIDVGQPWKDAFAAEALLGWDDRVMESVTKAYDIAFFDCQLSSYPEVYRESVQGAHEYATDIARNHPDWKKDYVDEDGNVKPCPGEPKCNGDTIVIPPWKRWNVLR